MATAHRSAGLRLLGGALLAPVAWFVQLEASYAIVPWACGRRVVLQLVAAITIAAAVAGAALAWRGLRAREAEIAAGQEPARDFVARASLGSSLLFVLVTVATTIPTIILSPCG